MGRLAAQEAPPRAAAQAAPQRRTYGTVRVILADPVVRTAHRPPPTATRDPHLLISLYGTGHSRALLRRRPDGFSAPFAEKTWHRVLLAEKLRRLLQRHAAAPHAAGERTAQAEAGRGDDTTRLFVQEFNGGLISRAASGGGGGGTGVSEAPAAAGLLHDIRLDGRQRALIVRLGQALCEGEVQPVEAASLPVANGEGPPPPAEAGVAVAAATDDATAGTADATAYRPTRRERRRTQQEKGGGRRRRGGGGAPERAEEMRERLGALDKWLD